MQEYDRLAHCFCLQWTSGDSFERERNALAAADAQGDDPTPQSVAAHRVDEAGRQNRASGTDRMAMGNGAAVDIDDVRREPQLVRDGNDDSRRRPR